MEFKDQCALLYFFFFFFFFAIYDARNIIYEMKTIQSKLP